MSIFDPRTLTKHAQARHQRLGDLLSGLANNEDLIGK
jgi:hypothetical protein